MSLPTLPFVSVIVPVWNEQRNIVRCIETLLAQDYPADRYEIIVVDNNSTDDTPQIVQRYFQRYPVTLLYEREFVGPAAGRNRGVRHARGEIVAFTDGDCLPEPDWLAQLVAAFADPGVVGAVGSVKPISETGLISEFVTTLNPIGSHEIGGLWYVATANAAFRRQALLEIGSFNHNLFTGEDVDLGLRLQLGGSGRIVGAPGAIIRHPFPNTWHELSERFRRYGYSEILLDTLFRGNPQFMRTPRKQLTQMLRQFGALFVYVASFFYRLIRSIFTGWNKKTVTWPLLWLSAESNSLIGKIYGIIKTRGFSKCVPAQKVKVKPVIVK